MKVEFILTWAIVAILLVTFTPTAGANSTVEIINLSRNTYTFTFQHLGEMPQTTIYAEIYCYGSLVASGDWSGVQLNYLLTQANITSEVNSIQFTASDHYTVMIPIQLALAPETIIAYQKDGAKLSGLRLVLPGVNGASWIDQIVSINMGTNEFEAPPAAAGTGARGNLVENIIESRQTPPASTSAPNQTQTTPKPMPDNSPVNSILVPSNTSESNQTLRPQTEQSQSINLDAGVKASIAIVFAASSAFAAILAYKNKRKLKTTHTINQP